MLILEFVIVSGLLILMFFVIWIVRPDHIEFSAILTKIFNFTLKAGRRDQAHSEPGNIRPDSRDDDEA